MSGLGLARELRDGYEVHRAALAHGLDVSLFARQVMEVSSSADGTRGAFVHGVPQTSTLSGVTFAQDIRMRRAVLTRAGFRVPAGATFSVGEGKVAARRFAEKIGYPVVVKPAVGDNTTEVMTGISSREDLRASIDHLYTPPESRPDHTRAAYSLTELRELGQRGDQTVVPPGYRFLVEKQVRGQYVRLLVLEGEVINALHLPDGAWREPEHGLRRDISRAIHPSIEQLAVEAVDAVQGIALAAVDVVVEDFTRENGAEDAVVVEFSERPWLAAQHQTDPELAASAGEEILRSGVGGLPPGVRRELVTVDFTLDGGVQPASLAAAVTAEAQRLGLAGEAHVEVAAVGRVSGIVRGSPARIAWIFEQLLDQGVGGERAMALTARQVEYDPALTGPQMPSEPGSRRPMA